MLNCKMGWHQILNLLCFLIFLHSFHAFASPLCPPDQRDSLLLFKNSFMIDTKALDFCDFYQMSSYPKTNSWNKAVDCCSWDGVTCTNVTGNVISLNLSCSRLRGTLYSNISLILPKLEVLRLSGNRIGGEIPMWFWGISDALKLLDLSDNLLVGGTQQLHQMQLLHVELQNNLVQGPLPIPPPSTSYFDASNNNFTGEISPSICELNSLRVLNLSNNNFSGNMPQCFDSMTNLSYLILSRNNFQGPLPIPPPSTSYFLASSNGFTGEIPLSICQLKSLHYLDLSANNLSGNIPPFLGNMTNLSYLILSSNNFQGPLLIPPPSTSYFLASSNDSTGEIPLSICQLKSLCYLDLSANNLSGNIPPCLGSMTNLSHLHLSSNKFQGPLPIPPPSTSSFLADYNGFTGEIPLSICQLKSLGILRLSANKLFGNIPPCLSSMTNLLHLGLDSNRFQWPLPIPPFAYYFSASDNGFIGEIPPSICQLSSLMILNLSNNSLFANLPPCFSNMTNLLVLDLSSNYFTGQLPTKVFLNNSLDVIDLSNNMIRGPIPLPSPITFYYDIARNDITGKITPLICNATKLEVIDLSNNGLTSRLPQCLTNFSTKLLVLNLRKNHLEGTIPQSFSLRSNLATLDLSQNWFKGTLPRSLVECKHLEVLDLSNNQIDDTFPSWLGKLPELKVLSLRSNNFKDLLNIPRGAHLFSNLHILDLSNNNFCGPLPTNLLMNLKAMMDGKNGQDKLLYMERQSYENSMTLTMKGLEIELVKILTILTIVDLSHNSFQGDIPEMFGHLHSLIGLNLSHNYLTGSIPLTLGSLTDLEWLDLSSNKLNGAIPRKLGDLSFLGSLNLSKNQLTGRIPQDKQLSTFSSDSFSGNPGLCGTPLPKACPSNAQPPQPSPSSTFVYKGHESWFKQKTVWIGYASGIVIGISIAYIALEIGRPKWLAQGVQMLERRAAEWMERPKWKAIKFHGQ